MKILTQLAVLAVPVAIAASPMPVARQNELVHRYCAVCHTDAARNGGLSLEHFDAARAAPSLAAMMVSKFTGGVSLETAQAASSEPGASALVARKMRTGAMGAAGIPIPDKATIDALIDALASKATGAYEWAVETNESGPTASILRELPSQTNPGEAVMYRLVLNCDGTQLAWAPLPKAGALSVTVDGNAPAAYAVEGTETMGNGSPATTGHSAIALEVSPLPLEALTIRDLSPGESVTFPFAALPEGARQSLKGCRFSPSRVSAASPPAR
jgi:hypothetical protein